MPGKSGSVFVVHVDVVDLDAVDGQPEHRAGGRHPVVGVGVPGAAVQRARVDRQRRRPPRPRRRRGGSARWPSAASRSVSCPRMWAMPVRWDGPIGERGQRGEHRRQLARRRADRRRARAIVAVPRTVSVAVAQAARRRPSARAGRAARRRPASWRPASAARVTDPAGHERGGEERRGVGQVGLDDPVARRGPGRARPATRRRPAHATRDARPPRARPTVMSMCGCDGTASGAGVHDLDALVVAGAGQQQPGHELRRRRRVDVHGAAVDPSPRRAR